MAYCQTDDLLTGSIPTPAYLDKQKFVDDAANEMDSTLGRRYATPIILSEQVPEQRPGYLTLKRINAHLATGRLILAAAAGGEDDKLHAYGWSLVRECLATLKYLAEPNNPELVGAKAIPGLEQETTHLKVVNADTGSFVDEFYNLTNPTHLIDGTPRYF